MNNHPSMPPVSDAGFVPPDLSDAEWEQRFLDYFAAIRAELADSERPLRTVMRRGEIWGHEIAFPYGPYIGPDALHPEPDMESHVIELCGSGGYLIAPDSENENPGYRMRPYLIPSDPTDPPVEIPYGFADGDAAEAATRIVKWIFHRL